MRYSLVESSFGKFNLKKSNLWLGRDEINNLANNFVYRVSGNFDWMHKKNDHFKMESY